MKKPKQPKAKNAGKARKAPKSAPVAAAPKSMRTAERDPRLPAVGTTIVRPYKGKDIRVKVLADGFEYEGTHYRSLTKVALVATGYNAISGPAFFRLTVPAPAKLKVVKSKAKAAPAASAAPTESAPETAAPTS
ncbi:MAG: DUF2924 domain-containing protein [Planctomycetia bacterium]|nr:DUF2924 domain-containing protein [Planctomycetia bacterium]